jgi:hypothetical protein
MKRKTLFRVLAAAALLAGIGSFDSCNTCKMCAINQYENGSITVSGTESEYCGADLIKQEAIPDVTVGSITTKVECR